MWPAPSAINWLTPWLPIPNGQPDDNTARELYNEVSKQHILYGIKARPVACRQDCDDVLFELLDESGRFAVVHLTFAQHPEPNPVWPNTEIHADWSAFVRDRMRPDADEWAT